MRRKKTYARATEAEQQRLLLKLAETKAKMCIGLSLFEGYGVAFKPEQQAENADLPVPLRSVYKEDDGDSPDAKANVYALLDNIIKKQQEMLEKATRSQSATLVWHEHRAGRITASKARAVIKTSKESPSSSLIKSIYGPSYNEGASKAPATIWGKTHKPHAKDLLTYLLTKQLMSSSSVVPTGNVQLTIPMSHLNLKVTSALLWLSKDHPMLAASPDSFIKCESCDHAFVEVKGSYNHTDYFSSSTCCLTKDFALKETTNACYSYSCIALGHLMESLLCGHQLTV